MFDRLDANQDGTLSSDEVAELAAPLRDRLFRGDTDGNGVLTRDELEAAAAGLKEGAAAGGQE